MFNKLFKNRSSGFSLVEILIGSTLIIVGILANTSTLTAYLAEVKGATQKQTITVFKNRIVQLVQSSDDLSRMGAAQGDDCLKSRLNCAAGTNVLAPLSITEASGAVLTNNANERLGFNSSALPCTDFPSRACPFRYEVSWRAICAPGLSGCEAPMFQIVGNFFAFEGLTQKYNVQNYSFTMNLGQVIGTYEQSCTSIGGTYVSGNPPECQLPLSGQCPLDASGARQILYKFDRVANTKQCRPIMWDISCPADNVMVGINLDGTAACRPKRFTCCNGTTTIDSTTCPICPLPCQVDPNQPACNTGDGGGGDSTPSGDGGCGGDGGDGCP
jgi:Tfp pilus assembly protein PilV